jgi:tetratricopeptide (TPR) repeat protein
MIVAELLHASWHSAEARQLLELAAATLPQAAWRLKVATQDARITIWAQGEPGEEQDGPYGIGDRENPAVAVLSPRSDLPQAEREVCCNLWFGLADVTDHLGDRKASEDALHRSLVEAMAVGNRTYIVRALGILADQRSQDKQREQAEALYAAAIALTNDRPLTRGNLTVNRARNALAAGGHERAAFEWLTQAQRDFARVGDERGKAAVALGLADLSLRGGDANQATLLFMEALRFAKRVGDVPVLYEAGLGVARAARLANQPELVEPALKGALSAARALGNTAGEQRVLGMLDLRNAPDGRS